MKTVTEHIRNHIFEILGMVEHESIPDLKILKETEWSKDFESLMRQRLCSTGFSWCNEFITLKKNRLIMGRFRYGKLGEAKGLDRVGSIKRRIALYEETGNAEHLVDISNISMMEYVEQNHPNYHWEAQDDGYHDQKQTALINQLNK